MSKESEIKELSKFIEEYYKFSISALKEENEALRIEIATYKIKENVK